MADPVWRQIAEDLRAKIEFGELGSDGKLLPSELDLRDSRGTSHNTLYRATAMVYRADRNQFVVNVGEVPVTRYLDARDELAPAFRRRRYERNSQAATTTT